MIVIALAIKMAIHIRGGAFLACGDDTVSSLVAQIEKACLGLVDEGALSVCGRSKICDCGEHGVDVRPHLWARVPLLDGVPIVNYGLVISDDLPAQPGLRGRAEHPTPCSRAVARRASTFVSFCASVKFSQRTMMVKPAMTA